MGAHYFIFISTLVHHAHIIWSTLDWAERNIITLWPNKVFVVPTTTSPWIWPSNGKILRGPYQIFWILTLMEVLRHVYMTNFSYIYFRLLKVEGAWSFLDDLIMIVGDWYSWSSFWYHQLIGGWIRLRWIPFDGMFMVELIWFFTYPSKVFQVVYHCLPFSPFQWPFSPFKGLWILTSLMSLFSQV